MTNTKRNSLILIAAFAAVYVIWGSTYLAIRVAIESIPPFLMAGARFFVAGIALYVWARRRGTPAPTRVEWRAAALIGTLLLLGGNGLVTWAELVVPSGLAAVLVATVPLWVVTLDATVLRGPRPPLGVVFGVFLGIVGVALLLDPRGTGEPVSIAGAVAILIASASWATGSLLSRNAKLPTAPTMATAAEMITGGVALFVVGTVGGEWKRLDMAAITQTSALALGYLIVFGSIVALSAYTYLLRNAPASAVSTYAFVNPVVAVFLGWLLLGESVDARMLGASGVIVCAVIVIQVARARANRPAGATIEPPRTDVEPCPAGAGSDRASWYRSADS